MSVQAELNAGVRVSRRGEDRRGYPGMGRPRAVLGEPAEGHDFAATGGSRLRPSQPIANIPSHAAVEIAAPQ